MTAVLAKPIYSPSVSLGSKALLMTPLFKGILTEDMIHKNTAGQAVSIVVPVTRDKFLFDLELFLFTYTEKIPGVLTILREINGATYSYTAVVRDSDIVIAL
jgi:hypothetical protein